jgi:hypothetical protein
LTIESDEKEIDMRRRDAQGTAKSSSSIVISMPPL